jgi:hypothetical protein
MREKRDDSSIRNERSMGVMGGALFGTDRRADDGTLNVW